MNRPWLDPPVKAPTGAAAEPPWPWSPCLKSFLRAGLWLGSTGIPCTAARFFTMLANPLSSVFTPAPVAMLRNDGEDDEYPSVMLRVGVGSNGIQP